MSTANTTLAEPVRQLIEQRLEMIDQSLAGLLPRQERLAAVAHLEARICNLAANATAVSGQTAISSIGSNAVSPGAPVPYRVDVPAFGAPGAGWQAGPPAKKSRLAIASGLLGIGAIMLMLGLPITYALIMMVGELVGEIAAISILGVHTVAVGMAGMTAIALSLWALLTLRRRRGSLTGHGWAITGLCTGPLPILACGAAGLMLLLELGVGMSSFTVSEPVHVTAEASDVHGSPMPPELEGSNPPLSGSDSPDWSESPQYRSIPSNSPVRSVGHAMPTSTLQPVDDDAPFAPPIGPGSKRVLNQMPTVDDDCPYGPGPVPSSTSLIPTARPPATPTGNPPETDKAAAAPTEPAPSARTPAQPANPQPATELPTPVDTAPTSEPVLGTSDFAPLGI
jgi:hypothetical protein